MRPAGGYFIRIIAGFYAIGFVFFIAIILLWFSLFLAEVMIIVCLFRIIATVIAVIAVIVGFI